MDKGVYILLIEVSACSLKIGALGSVTFKQGFYAYVGSALGSGGLERVKRHIRTYRTKSAKLHWHIDYLLISPFVTSLFVYCLKTSDRIECSIAGSLNGCEVTGFGSSDCDCRSHLFYFSMDPHNHIIQILGDRERNDLKVSEII
jgi:Uri superfamily endonuclease